VLTVVVSTGRFRRIRGTATDPNVGVASDASGLLPVASDDARRHPAADVEVAFHLQPARRAVGDQLLEHLVHDLLLQDRAGAEAGQVVAQRPELEQPVARDVADRDRPEVGAAGERTDRRELRVAELDLVGALREAVRQRLDQRRESTS
jgi:hypothetical protein